MSSALSHLRVLDLSRVLAGPCTSQTLADLGAEVIKIERPGTGDDTRAWGPPYLHDRDGNAAGESAYFRCANRGKKSVTLDIATLGSKLSFVRKLWLPLILGLLCLADLSIYNAYHTRDIRYGEVGYFTIVNSHPTILMHPTKPVLNGKDVSDERDPNGVYIEREMVAVIKRDGKGFTAYAFPKPGKTEASPKIVYNVSYQPWDWILSTGFYIDDIDAAFRSSLYQSLGILVGLAAALSAVVAVLNRGIFRALGGEPSYAAEIANQIANNDLTAVVKTAPDDSSSLLFSMKRMQAQLTQTIGVIKVSADSIAKSVDSHPAWIPRQNTALDRHRARNIH